MQINGFGGVSAYNPYAKTNSSSQIKSVQMPEFGFGLGKIWTKAETNSTDEEIKNAMIELAKQDARNGIFGQDLDKTLTKTRWSKEYEAIMGEYVQSVSPDRAAIFPAGIAQLGRATKLKGTTPLIDDSLTQLMLNGARVNMKNNGVMYDAKSKMMFINHSEFFIGNENIGSYDMTYGWSQSLTNEENTKYKEMGQIYLNTWKAETAKMAAEN